MDKILGQRTYIIAEAGVNHNGSLDMAMQLIDVAAQAGADAVKFQTFIAEKEISQFAPKADYQLKTTQNNESQLEMVKKLELNEAAHIKLIEHCQSRKIAFLSTPFDLDSVALLHRLGVGCLKIPSGEITNGLLLLKIAMTGLPVILSTGMSTLSEIETALGVLAFGYLHENVEASLPAFIRAYCSDEGQQALQNKVRLLHCTTEYPAPFDSINLRAMNTLSNAFNLPVGLSDHSVGIAVPIAAVARGAVIVEKHFTLDRNLEGPDHKASLEPNELAEMVNSIRQVEQSMGNSIKKPMYCELANQAVARKSLVANHSIRQGECFTTENLTTKRPATGISAMQYWEYLGKVAARDYQEDELI